MKKISLVLTTINVPLLVKEYLDNFSAFGWNDVKVIIIGDVKSHKGKTRDFIEKLHDQNNSIQFLDIDDQEKWMKEYPKLCKIIPYNSDNRRNLGYLMAFQHGAEIIISIDDDNYPTKGDFILGHSIVGDSVTLPTITSSNGWFNPCSLLKNDKNVEIYPRGFPYSKRFEQSTIDTNESRGKVAINLGLWINDPDVDAITHLALPVKITGFNASREKVMVGRHVYCPIDSQNTSVSRTALVAYYFTLMGADVYGTKIDRFGDIWQGYFAKKIIDAMDERVVIGTPLTDHRRNKHDLLKDLQKEIWGIAITEKLVSWLTDIEIEHTNSYVDAYLELVDKLETDAIKITDNESILRYFQTLVDSMRTWVDTYEKLA